MCALGLEFSHVRSRSIRAGRGGDVLVALAAAGLVGNLVSGHRPDDTAQDRAGRVGDVLAAGNGLDARDRAAVGADAAAVGRGAAVAAAVAGRGGAACSREGCGERGGAKQRSEEHTSELQSLMRISYAVFCLKKNKTKN